MAASAFSEDGSVARLQLVEKASLRPGQELLPLIAAHSKNGIGVH